MLKSEKDDFCVGSHTQGSPVKGRPTTVSDHKKIFLFSFLKEVNILEFICYINYTNKNKPQDYNSKDSRSSSFTTIKVNSESKP